MLILTKLSTLLRRMVLPPPKFIYPNHPKCIVYIMIHSWCCTFYGFEQMYNNIPTIINSDSIFNAVKILCALPIYPNHSHNPWKPLIFFIVSIVLPLPECHIIGSIYCVAFSVCLLSLINMNLRLPHVFSWLDSSLLFNTE